MSETDKFYVLTVVVCRACGGQLVVTDKTPERTFEGHTCPRTLRPTTPDDMRVPEAR